MGADHRCVRQIYLLIAGGPSKGLNCLGVDRGGSKKPAQVGYNYPMANGGIDSAKILGFLAAVGVSVVGFFANQTASLQQAQLEGIKREMARLERMITDHKKLGMHTGAVKVATRNSANIEANTNSKKDIKDRIKDLHHWVERLSDRIHALEREIGRKVK